jgi:hypothetical protein
MLLQLTLDSKKLEKNLFSSSYSDDQTEKKERILKATMIFLSNKRFHLSLLILCDNNIK